MFVFGKEQPAANNESLYEKKSGADELCSDQSKGRRVNRYSVVSKDGNTDSIPLVIRALLSQTGLRIIVLVAWLVKLPGKSSVAAKVIEKKYLKEGWSTCVKNDHYLASKEIELNEVDSWPPLGIKISDGGVLLLAGNEAKENMLNVVNDECSSFLARTRYFVPDSEFFSQLVSSGVCALYQVNDDQNNPGIVLIGKPVLSMTSEENIDISTS